MNPGQAVPAPCPTGLSRPGRTFLWGVTALGSWGLPACPSPCSLLPTGPGNAAPEDSTAGNGLHPPEDAQARSSQELPSTTGPDTRDPDR